MQIKTSIEQCLIKFIRLLSIIYSHKIESQNLNLYKAMY